MLFALDPLWNDIYTAGGFWVGVVGLFVGVAGFGIAIKQTREARRAAEKGQEAAEAARDAANNTLAKSKEAYEWFVGTFASRLLSELQGVVITRGWQVARLRCNDLAELFASLPTTGDGAVARAGTTCAAVLRELAEQFTLLESRGGRRMSDATAAKWNEAQALSHAVLDRLKKPFREASHG